MSIDMCQLCSTRIDTDFEDAYTIVDCDGNEYSCNFALCNQHSFIRHPIFAKKISKLHEFPALTNLNAINFIFDLSNNSYEVVSQTSKRLQRKVILNSRYGILANKSTIVEITEFLEYNEKDVSNTMKKLILTCLK